MKIGNIIKYHRNQRKLTQRELCHGICSVTQLSRIESNSKGVDDATAFLLLERLGVSFFKINNLNTELDKHLELLIRFIIFFDQVSASNQYILLKNKEDEYHLSDKIYTYKIYLFRYYLFTNDLEKSSAIKIELSSFFNVFSSYEKDLFDYCNAILLLQQGNYIEALEIFRNLEERATLPVIYNGEFFYLTSLLYSNINDSSKSITYAQKALKAFGDQFNYIRVLHAQILLGIHYTELGLFQDAHEQYEHLLRNSNLINNSEIITAIHHNYAIFCERQKKYEKAINHYTIAQNKSKTSFQYYLSLCNLTEILIRQNKKNEALKNINTILRNTRTKELEKYYMTFKYHKYAILDKTSLALGYLEKHLLPYLERNNLNNDIRKFTLLLADYYKDVDKDKSIFYYEKLKGVVINENNFVY